MAAVPERSLYSGSYGEEDHSSLMIAVEAESGPPRFMGYYNDGRCRFSFRGDLAPFSVGRLQTYPEAYEAQAWVPDHPERLFPIVLYSQVQERYRQQITVELGRREDRPVECPSSFSLDRFGSVGDFVDVRVVKPGRLRMHEVKTQGKRASIVRKGGRPPRAWSGVWIRRTYSKVYSPPGYLDISWYVYGSGNSALVRSNALFALPPEDEPQDGQENEE